MKAKPYQTRKQVTQLRPVMTAEEFAEANESSQGWCLACGQTAWQVEPDARRYQCESCGCAKVYGFEELLLMGLVILTGEEEEEAQPERI